MTDLKAYLHKLHQNLNLLQEREAKFGGNAPLELLHQLNDHRQAIALTEQALKGDLSEAVWREALAPLLVSLPPLEADDAALREAYLTRLLDQAGYLSLAGLDPKAATAQSEARLNLDAVYTALLTLSQEQDKTFEVSKTSKVIDFDSGRESRRMSALAQLNQHPRLVLLGDPGSGKSTFVNFVVMCLAGQLLNHPRANLALLTTPLPNDEGQPEAEAQSWTLGPLLPVPVILRDLAARGLPPPPQTATVKHLWDFITADLTAAAWLVCMPGAAEPCPISARSFITTL